MLTYLKIENLATVAELVLRPGPGFNVLSGETGAGKSVIVESLALAFGGRARRELVRTGCERAVVTAAFDLEPDPQARELLRSLGLPDSEALLVVKREIAANGRHRVLLNGEPATLGMLERLGSRLGELHGQHENQSLLRTATHLGYLDEFAGLGSRLARAAELHAELADIQARLESLELRGHERAQRLDILDFQLRAIEEAQLPEPPREGEEDEDERVAREHRRAARAEELAAALERAAALLVDDDDAALPRLARAARVLEPVAELVDSLPELLDELEDARIRLQEAARSLAAAGLEAEWSPAELAALDDRLRVLEGLKRRYGPSLEDVRAHRLGLVEEREELEALDERRAELLAARESAAERFAEEAGELSRRRRRAGRRLGERAGALLAELDMPRARLVVEQAVVEDPDSPLVVSGRRLAHGPTGVDRVQLLFTANEGEEPRPLARVASGGELSRVMLVLKGLTTEAAAGRAWVFDEVDSGVGGQAALRVAERLASLAEAGAQVFCVSHLPQVAARADVHHLVEKCVAGRRTETRARVLDAAERVDELARMLSGGGSEAALRHAEELLAAAAEGVP